jgi:hypothetical protein
MINYVYNLKMNHKECEKYEGKMNQRFARLTQRMSIFVSSPETQNIDHEPLTTGLSRSIEFADDVVVFHVFHVFIFLQTYIILLLHIILQITKFIYDILFTT